MEKIQNLDKVSIAGVGMFIASSSTNDKEIKVLSLKMTYCYDKRYKDLKKQ